MFRKLKAGITSQAVPIFVFDTSSSVGAGLGSLVYNTSGLTAKYRRQGQNAWTSITLQTMTLGTWASGGFVANTGTSTGNYEFGIPDACLATGAGVTWVQIEIYGATNMLPVTIFIELDQIDYQDSLRAGLTALPSGNAGSLSGLPISYDNAGGVNVIKINGVTQTANDLYTTISGVPSGVLSYNSHIVQSGLPSGQIGTLAFLIAQSTRFIVNQTSGKLEVYKADDSLWAQIEINFDATQNPVKQVGS